MARLGWTILCVTISAIIAFLVTVQAAKKRDTFALSTLKILAPGGGHGSGVHTGNRFVITAAHVVAGSKTVKVKASHGGESVADVLWTNDAHDVALLRARELTGVENSRLDCGQPAQIGAKLLAVGNPGPLEFIHAFGHVSSGLQHNERWADYYIAAMAVAPGMSGGPVINERGQVVGIVVGVALSTIGFGASMVSLAYIVPSRSICRMLAR